MDCCDAFLRDRDEVSVARLAAEALAACQSLTASSRDRFLASGGTGALIGMRRRLLGGLDANPLWAAIEADLVYLLRCWFNADCLEFRASTAGRRVRCSTT